MAPKPGLAWLPWLMAFMIASFPGQAGEKEIQAWFNEFFEMRDLAGQKKVAAAIEADPAFTYQRVTTWLRQANLWTEHKPGRDQLGVNVGHGHGRRIAIRYPEGYRPDKAWPLILALHPSGVSGGWYMEEVVRILGDSAEEYLMAAPNHYRQTSIDSPPPFTEEHSFMIQAIRRSAHVDSDRIYVMGHSLGGSTAWTLATLHADIFAASIPISSAMGPNDAQGLWQATFANFKHLPILHIWGARDDSPVLGYNGKNVGSIAHLNKILAPLIKQNNLTVENHPVKDAGHDGYPLPLEKIKGFLRKRRVSDPRVVEHSFRHIHQGRTYWLEANVWDGPKWDFSTVGIPTQAGETQAQAAGRVLLPLLGHLKGKINGQTITVFSRHVAELTVWFDQNTIDWKAPVKIIHNNKTVFEGQLERNLGVCLYHAAISGDFQRLPWAGIRIEASGEARLVKVNKAAPLWRRDLMAYPESRF